MAELPNELLHKIAEELHPSDWRTSRESEKRDLYSFSLVSRRLRGVGQAHLFQDIIFPFRCASEQEQWLKEDGSGLQEWNPQWEKHPFTSWQTLAMFRDFLRDHPPLAQSIKRLHLTAFPIGVPESDEDAGQEPLGLLSFQELTLQDVIVISVPSYWEALHAPLPALRRLNVTYLRRTYSQSHVGDILGCFSALDYVRVQNMPSAEEWPDDTAPPGMRVTTFVCLDEQPQVEWLLDYLFDSPSVETLRALHVGAIAAEFPLYRELLDAVRPRLEVFDFTLPVPWDSEAFATEQPEAALPPTSPFSLSGFASLRCLTLRFPMYSGMADADSDHWRPLAKILETCSKCRHLSAIDFLIHDVHKAVTSSSLASILSAVEDSLLGLHASASVEDVHFIVAGAAPFETNVEEQLKEVCPPLIQKVKIRVSRTDLDPKDWVGLDFGIPADGVFMAE